MSWQFDKWRREWEDWREDRERLTHACKEFSHAFVNFFVEGIRHHAYTIGHVLVLAFLIAVIVFGIYAGVALKPPI